jgi:hypothetical protein
MLLDHISSVEDAQKNYRWLTFEFLNEHPEQDEKVVAATVLEKLVESSSSAKFGKYFAELKPLFAEKEVQSVDVREECAAFVNEKFVHLTPNSSWVNFKFSLSAVDLLAFQSLGFNIRNFAELGGNKDLPPELAGNENCEVDIITARTAKNTIEKFGHLLTEKMLESINATATRSAIGFHWECRSDKGDTIVMWRYKKSN